MSDPDGSKSTKFNEIIDLGVNYFNHLFTTLDMPNITKIIKLEKLLPRFITQEENED